MLELARRWCRVGCMKWMCLPSPQLSGWTSNLVDVVMAHHFSTVSFPPVVHKGFSFLVLFLFIESGFYWFVFNRMSWRRTRKWSRPTAFTSPRTSTRITWPSSVDPTNSTTADLRRLHQSLPCFICFRSLLSNMLVNFVVMHEKFELVEVPVFRPAPAAGISGSRGQWWVWMRTRSTH